MKKTVTKKASKNSVRLTPHVVPLRYEITLTPDLESHVFSGSETIELSLGKQVKEITLHSKDLEIFSAKLSFGKQSVEADAISYDEDLETATFHFSKSIQKGKCTLALSFTGVLADTMRGFYKSQYMVDGENRWMATTQFEATDARRAFPCFDEPAQKAVFTVHLVIPNEKTAISNTLPHTVREHEAGYKIVSFAPTPRMSTYLLAFIVGDFEWIEQKTKSGVLVRVMTVPGKSHQGKFALDTTVRCLEFYEQYFAIRYPLDTLDMIAIPDFSSLAMENWGAITFREIGLLLDEAQTSTSAKEMIAEVIAHELAHQWFGNLVTMEWWTHLWLNEGFATYVPYLAMESLFPEWNMWEKFSTDTLMIALKLDALKHTHPIEVEVHHPNEIGEIFDAVSYKKGASVIRMLAEYIGDSAFQKGLCMYLKAHSYKNASTVHLWEAFEKASKKPVKKMMAIWTGTSGYPMLTVKSDGKKMTLTQKRFYSSAKSRMQSKDTTLWPIPLSATTSKGEKSFGLMNKRTLAIPHTESWCKINAHEGSVFRTRYEGALLGALVEPIRMKKMNPTDRLGVIRDLFAFAEAGEADTTTVFEMLKVYENETELTVWTEIISGLRYIANLLVGTPAYESFRTFASASLSSIVEHVGWDEKGGESHNEKLLRPIVLGVASFFGHVAVIAEAKKRFADRVKNPIHADLRGVVYATVAREGGEKEYNTLHALYQAETLHEEKNRLLGALGCFRDKTLLSRTLAMTLSDAVRMQDRNGAFASVLVNPFGRELGWKFIKKNWKKIGEAYGDGNHLLSRLVGVLNRNTSRTAYDDIAAFFKTHNAPAAERTVEQTLEHIDSNIRWLARDGKKIQKWLRENS